MKTSIERTQRVIEHLDSKLNKWQGLINEGEVARRLHLCRNYFYSMRFRMNAITEKKEKELIAAIDTVEIELEEIFKREA